MNKADALGRLRDLMSYYGWDNVLGPAGPLLEILHACEPSIDRMLTLLTLLREASSNVKTASISPRSYQHNSWQEPADAWVLGDFARPDSPSLAAIRHGKSHAWQWALGRQVGDWLPERDLDEG